MRATTQFDGIRLALAIVLSATLGTNASGQVPVEIHEDALLVSRDVVGMVEYGKSVDIWGNTAVVGTPESPGTGAVYVYVRDGHRWQQQARLTPANIPPGELLGFGYSVAIHADTVLVGSRGHLASDPPHARVFVRDDGVWTQQAQLPAAVFSPIALFGDRLALADVAFDRVRVYVRENGLWTLETVLETAAVGSDFGAHLAMSEDTLAIGAPLRDNPVDSGAVIVYVRTGTTWNEQALLKASDASAFQRFGVVSLSGDTLLVGNNRYGSTSSPESAYVFVRNGTQWTEQATLTGTGVEGTDNFGWPVDLWEDTALVGAIPGYSDSRVGTGHVFVRNGTSWTEQGRLVYGELDMVPNGGSRPTGLVISPSGRPISWTGENGDNRVFEVLSIQESVGIIGPDGDGLANLFDKPIDVAVDGAGNVLALDDEGALFRITPSGVVTHVRKGGDGTALAADRSGNAYVAEGSHSHSVIRVAPDGTETVLIDQTGDGEHELLVPSDVAVGPDGEIVVVGSFSDNAFRVWPDGSVEQILDRAGAAEAMALGPQDVVVDVAGNLYVAGLEAHNVVKRTPSGEQLLVLDASGDGLGQPLTGPAALALDGAGNLLVVGRGSDNVFRVTPAGAISVILDATGNGAGHVLDRPADVVVDGAGNVFVSGESSNNVFRVSPTGAVTQVLDLSAGGLGLLVSPRGLAVDAAGNLYATAYLGNRVFKLTPGGAVSLLLASDGDGAGNLLVGPRSVAVSPSGDLFVTGHLSDNVFRVEPNGTVTEIIDNTGDGSGVGVHRLDGPFDVQVAGADVVYVTGRESDNVFSITPSGVITPLAVAHFAPFPVSFREPTGLCVTDGGDVFFANLFTDNVLHLSTTDELSQVVGVGLDEPRAVTIDREGNVFVAGLGTNNVLRIDRSGHVDEILAFEGDGVHPLVRPLALAVDRDGNLFAGTAGNIVGADVPLVLKVTPTGTTSQVLYWMGDGEGHEFEGVTGLAVNDRGILYVADGWSFGGYIFAVSPDGSVDLASRSTRGERWSHMALDGCTAVVGFSGADVMDVDAGSAWSFDLSGAQCLLVIGAGPGASAVAGVAHDARTQVGPTVEHHVTLAGEAVEFVLPEMLGGTAGVSADDTPAWLLDGELAAQVVLWDPERFPDQPEQWSAGIAVRLLPGGRIATATFGTRQGDVELAAEIATNARGQRVLRFPFRVAATSTPSPNSLPDEMPGPGDGTPTAVRR